jgi:polyisoprenoid-binding protein YceI
MPAGGALLIPPPRGAARRPWRTAAARAAGTVVLVVLAASNASSETFRVDPQRSHLAVRTHRDGIGSGLAHDHVVEATEVSGRVEYDPGRPEASSITVETRSASLSVDGPTARRRLGVEGDLSESQRADVAKAMRGPDQLDVARHPTIRFTSTRVVPEGDGRLRVTGALTLRGVTREVTFPATVGLEGNALRGRAILTFRQSSFGYRPYSALLGAIRNKDEVSLHVDLLATP